ncbi:SDR family NAD(P)-dependent oxidoreductase [Parapedobacter indicus]|uniref:Gluconate 5-dehydrogenase n=1 Tax=Parapedobacter indicus TaxID=1477437 RepID=A0A1I3SGD6_9SPHI|nr:SDR family NAD(P)-dependent oxidoreductase [Parapedobacter indicus]PPK99849.1 gluconate 5-dehydrogenase [Parapedobacter indicus]SFJ56769.1 gluconate 5-dehydrogenase [Parapedobacter indicus]
MGNRLFELMGKNALVTGSTQGIGLAIARGLGAAGARIIINGRDNYRVQDVAAMLQADGLNADGYSFDVTDERQVSEAVAGIESAVGPIDILVNNAGIIRRVPTEELEESDWNAVIQTNLTAPFLVSKHVGKFMIRRKRGKIIHICSLMSELGRDTVSAYAAAKGGLKMLTRNLATEWAVHNIQVNAIGPGYIATPINISYRDPDNPLNRYIISRTPAGRWGTPDDLVGTAVFLASAASDFVNGQLIYVDGGLVTSFGKPFDN